GLIALVQTTRLTGGLDYFSSFRSVCGTIVNTYHYLEDQKGFLTRLKINFIKNVK
ncbi:hypothetical protein SMU108_03598, partial [Streptococcus mutans M230]